MIVRWRLRAGLLKREIYALYLAYRHPDTPWYAKWVAACVVAYAFSPIDLIPDFIPVLGYLDDLLLVPLGIGLAIKMIPLAVMAASRAQAQAAEQRSTSWGAAVAIVALWVALAAAAIMFGLRVIGK